MIIALSILSFIFSVDFSHAQGKISGGLEYPIEQFPYQVSIRYNNKHHCGGSIIRNNIILTAAHCVYGLTERSLTVRAGSRDSDSGGQLIGVKKIINHPQYSASRTTDYDLSLLELASMLLLGITVRPIRLPAINTGNPNEPRPGAVAWVSGYGASQPGGQSSRYLRAVSMPIIEREACRKVYGYSAVRETMICADTRNVDFCHGDTGGPLVIDLVQYGIASWGNGCGDPQHPAVFTNVFSFMDFVQQYI